MNIATCNKCHIPCDDYIGQYSHDSDTKEVMCPNCKQYYATWGLYSDTEQEYFVENYLIAINHTRNAICISLQNPEDKSFTTMLTSDYSEVPQLKTASDIENWILLR